MATQVREKVYTDRDNVITLVVIENEEAKADLSAITRVVFIVGGITTDSDIEANDIVWWTDQETYEDCGLVDVIKMRLGHQSIAVGTYTDGCLILYDAVNDDGTVYADDVRIIVKAACG